MSAFTALAEPTRCRILDELLVGEPPVNDLVDRLEIGQPSVSKHLRVLREAGLVEVRVDAQHRRYRVHPVPLAEIDAWLVPYRALWTQRLDALERYLNGKEQR